MKKLITFCLAIGAAFSLQAQTFEMMYDCNPGSGDGDPRYITEYNGLVIFNALESTTSSNAPTWKSDGTPSGTEILSSINGSDFYEFNGLLFFRGYDGTASLGSEFYVSDGTTTGTVLLKDINTGISGSQPKDFVASGGQLFFTAITSGDGRELWVTDGTAAGTVMVKDINIGTGDGIINPSVSPFQESVAFDGKLVFWAFDGTDQGLWISDGTDTGTVLLQSIYSSSAFNMPSGMLEFDNKLYFMASDGINGLELWVTDGTPAGTVMLKDINPGSAHGIPFNFAVFSDKLYFIADNGSNGFELWQSDGTDSATVMLKDINPGINYSLPMYLTVFDGKLYFNADDGTNGRELWVSDGTDSGTVLFKDIFPGSGNGEPSFMTVYNGQLYFSAVGSVLNSHELWQSDGTSAGTIQIQPPLVTTSDPLGTTNEFVIAGGALFFPANYNSSGLELWKFGATPLPLIWLSFDGVAIGEHTAALVWKTTAETDVSYFEVQRSYDGKNFEAIGKVKSTGNRSSENEYRYTDNHVANKVAYYRLKQVDIDEQFSYSAIVQLSFSQSGINQNFTIAPNPGQDFISVQIANYTTKGILAIMDMNGKRIFHASVSGSTIKIPASPGIYMVTLMDEEGKVLESKKAIVN